MLEAALDAVVTMDHQGNVIGWNHAATAIFGYHPNEVIGREMADLIVPPHLRRAHRQGLARLLEGQQPKILDRRLELTGMRRDGTEFPVELTITRINLPGQPTFTGYLRDITERVRGEEELRASRVRLLEVADEERKRIQRNLHDGAQQRITAVLLNLGRLRDKPEERQELLGAAIDELVTGLDEIRALASGLHPAVLAERGLVPALRALVLAAPIEVELATLPEERLPEPVEAAAYYVVAEALANVQKHAGATRVVVHASTDEHRLVVEVADDGIGGADDAGSGLRGLTDRVEALGGRLSLDSPPGGGTRLLAEIPVS
jgi:PAS domain S-box-containing protein